MSTEGVEHRARLGEVYRLWWSHDAHWYQGVAKRFGQQVANEINAEAVRQVAVQVGRRVARHSGGLPDVHDPEEIRRRYEACGALMFPSELRDVSTQVVGDDLIEATVRRLFALVMLRMAGSLEEYACPCTDIQAGWAEGLGVTLSENRVTSCLRQGDPACRLLARTRTLEAEAEAGPAVEAEAGPAVEPDRLSR